MTGEITQALNQSKGPDLPAAMYAQLREIARRELRRQGSLRTLNATALVNEAWLKLAGAQSQFQSRAHFLATMAKVMRHVLIDHAREQGALRRGGDALRVTFDAGMEHAAEPVEAIELLAIHSALEQLAALDPRLERVLELRFFAGLTLPEIAEVMGCSEPTVKRDLRAARAFVATQLDPAEPDRRG